MLKLAEVDE